MTIDQFLKELPQTTTEYKWISSIDGMKCIRGEFQNYCYCPILALAFHKKIIKGYYNNFTYVSAGKALGLSIEDIREIVGAADGLRGPLRTKILKALGLKDPS